MAASYVGVIGPSSVLDRCRILLGILSCMILVGCGYEHDINTKNITEIDVMYFNDSKAATTTTYGQGTKQLRETVSWLEHNRAGWEPYLATVAVGDFLVRGKGFSLSIGHGIVVLNYQQNGDDYKQLSKELAGGEFEYLSAL